MILRLGGLLVRTLLEAALLLIVFGLILGTLGFRLTRRLVRDRPGRLDRILEAGVPPMLATGILLWERVNAGRGNPVESGPDS